MFKLWDWKDGLCIHTFEGLGFTVTKVITLSNPESNLFAMTNRNIIILIFNADEGSFINNIKNNQYSQFLCDIRREGTNLFVSVDHYTTIKIWNAEDGSLVGEIQLHKFSFIFFQFLKYFDNLNLLVLGGKRRRIFKILKLTL